MKWLSLSVSKNCIFDLLKGLSAVCDYHLEFEECRLSRRARVRLLTWGIVR
jgi:hypothetical protein